MDIDELKEFSKGIPGWLADDEGVLLYNLAKNCTSGEIVEIGSWKGKSTIWLAEGSKAGTGKKIYAIDPHRGYDGRSTLREFRQNMSKAGVKDLVAPIVKTSEQAAAHFNKPVGLIFIDGSHEYENVKKDMELWFPKLVNGGIMAFHDTLGYEGPRRVVNELVYKSRHFIVLGLMNNIVYARKVSENTQSDRARNRLMLLSKRMREMTIRKRG